MKTLRCGGKTTVTILPNGDIHIGSIIHEEGGELFSIFKYGKYLIKINQSKPIKLCRIPNIDHQNVIVLSLQEAYYLLEILHDPYDGFYGKILLRHNNAGNFTPIIILNLENIIKSAKRNDAKSVKREILKTLSHEFRHAEQYQKNLLPLNGFWRFAEWYYYNRWRFFKKTRSFIYHIICLITGALVGLSFWSHLFPIGIFLLVILFWDIIAQELINIYHPHEKDARRFSYKAMLNKNWRDCVMVEKTHYEKK